MSDIKILLDKNGMWYDALERYVSKVFEKWTLCHATSSHLSNKKV